MRVARFAGVQCKKKGKVCVVGVQQIQVAKVEGLISWDCGEKRVEQVKPFVVKLGIVDTENFVEVRGGTFDRSKIAVVQDDTQGKLAKVVAVEFDFLDALAQLPHLRFLRIVEEQVLRASVIQ